MADFVAVLRKTIDGLGDATPDMRERVYEKARTTVSAKLAALNPPPPPAVAERQKRALEEAIVAIERDFAPPPPPQRSIDPLDQLEDVFAALKNPQPKRLGEPPVARVEPPRPVVPDFSAGRASVQTAATPAAPAARIETPQVDTAPLPYDPSDDGSDFEEDEASPRRSYGGLIAAVVVLALLAGGGYGLWLNRDDVGDMVASLIPESSTTAEPAPAEPAPAVPAAETPVPAEGEGKFTQRMTPEGTEVDPGPAGGETTVGEGTTVAAATQPPAGTPPVAAQPEPAPEPTETPAGETTPVEAAAVPPETEEPAGETPVDPAVPAPPQTTAEAPAADPAAPTAAANPEPAAVPVGQRAIFYEERTNVAQGSAEPGSIVWSLVQESPGADQPAEPAIRAEATIPGKDVQLRMTIRRNADKTLPASHIVEMIFLTPDGFEGGGIDNILRIAMKSSEQEAGSPLIGVPAKIADGFFLVALNDTKPETDANMTLLRRQSWIDIPVVYKSGRRALFTMEKGIPGEKIFDEALKAWQVASAG